MSRHDGDAIKVNCQLKRTQENDPITAEIRESMKAMLESSKLSRNIHPTGTDLS